MIPGLGIGMKFHLSVLEILAFPSAIVGFKSGYVRSQS